MHNDGTQIMSEQQGASLPQIQIRPLQPGEDATAFRTLNEEWISQQLFQLAYLLGERRLGKMEALRCASKVQLLGNRDKVAKMSQLDVPIHIQKILIQLNKILDVINAPEQTALKAFSQCD